MDDANLLYSEEPPSRQFFFGTDSQGRDIFSRVIYGARISLSVGLLSQLMNSIIGIILGLTAGYFGKWWDDLVMGLTNIMLSIGLTNLYYTCRITRSQVLFTRDLNYVKAAQALGYGKIRIMFTQILPNIVGPILVIATLGIAGAILMEAALSFLGLGTQPPTPSWGGMLAKAREQIFTTPWISIFPGLAIFTTVLGLNLLGDGMRDFLDPHTAKKI